MYLRLHLEAILSFGLVGSFLKVVAGLISEYSFCNRHLYSAGFFAHDISVIWLSKNYFKFWALTKSLIILDLFLKTENGFFSVPVSIFWDDMVYGFPGPCVQ